MFYFRFSILLIIIGLQTASADESTWRLIYSSDFHGELKPCGCAAESDLGGVLRRATRFAQLRQQKIPTLIVSAGDILGPRDEQGIIKTRYMLAAQAKLGLDAILPGERDLAYSFDELTSQSLPWVLSNHKGDLPFSMHQQKRVNDRRLLIFGLLDPVLLDPDLIKPNKLTDMMQALQKNIKSQQVTKQDIVVVLIHAEPAKVKPFTQHPLVDVVVRGHLDKSVYTDSVTTSASQPIKTAVLAAGYRGQRIGVAEFVSHDHTQQISNRIEAIPGSIIDDPEMTHLYTEYDKEVSAWYHKKVASRQSSVDEVSPYAGAKACASCHIKIAQHWQTSGHAHALKSLIDAGKDNDPQCLICHNTGMGKQGGFLSQQTTPERVNVQCEACHGAAQRHVAYPLVNKPEKAATQCISCHSIENSPSFEFKKYWSKIVHHETAGIARHRQALSPVKGEYSLDDKERSLINEGPIVITEFFSFYCSHCYVLNRQWPQLLSPLARPVIHQKIPIIFHKTQSTLSARAYYAAEKKGKGEEFIQAVFKANFDHQADTDNKAALIDIAAKLGISQAVRQALNGKDTTAQDEFVKGMIRMDKLGINRTPTVLINNNVRVNAENTGHNIDLMIDNLREILMDIQCRQHAICEK